MANKLFVDFVFMPGYKRLFQNLFGRRAWFVRVGPFGLFMAFSRSCRRAFTSTDYLWEMNYK